MHRIGSGATFLFAIAVGVGAVPSGAEFSAAQGPAGSAAGLREKNPYGALFITQDTQKPDAQKPDARNPDARNPDAEKPDTKKPDIQKMKPFFGPPAFRRMGAAPSRVVCGMTVMQADPDVDPKMVRRPQPERQGPRQDGSHIDYKARPIT
jgi:hypothetical protein